MARPAKPGGKNTKVGQRDDERSSGPVKVLIWTGLVATVSSLMLLLARGLAVRIWRALTNREPPVLA